MFLEIEIMTILVGILCKDGVVVGTDSSATFAAGQFRTIEQETKKIDIISGQIIVAGTGQIGLGQRFYSQIHGGWHDKNIVVKHRLRWQKLCVNLEEMILHLRGLLKANMVL